MLYNQKEKIVEHYDLLSPYYRDLWGEHLHHGFWQTGDESKEVAQEALVRHLADKIDTKPGMRLLDAGCGYGGSSIYLAKHYGIKPTGITISPVQVKMATEAATKAGVEAEFLVMNAEQITLEPGFDIVWSIEAISHFADKQAFFNHVARVLKPGGTLALIDWFKKDDLSEAENAKYIEPIEKGMLVDLRTSADYTKMITAAGLSIVDQEDISKQTSKTWDISLGLVADKSLWKLALQHSADFISFLKSFNDMRQGFVSGNFRYKIIVAKK